MKAKINKETLKNQQQVLLINNHTYVMNKKQLTGTLKATKDLLRPKKKTVIYAVTKGNVTQMVEEYYNNAIELKKAISQYKCKGFHKVYYYLAV